MKEKRRIRVLVVDDEPSWHEIFQRRFGTPGNSADCPYAFEVYTASSVASCVKIIREIQRAGASFDVVVFDLWMSESKSAGLLGIAGACLGQSRDLPVVIAFTGHPTYVTCVDAMRMGAWDYVSKEDIGDRSAAQVVVDSAIARLRDLDHWYDLQEEISVKWYPAHSAELAEKFAGMMVALWDDPEIHVVAAGGDEFELEQGLEGWRTSRPIWQRPFILRVPRTSGSDEAES